MKKFLVFLGFAVFFAGGIAKANAEHFEFNWGFTAGWNDTGVLLGMGLTLSRFTFGWTTGEVEHYREELGMRSWGMEYVKKVRKEVSPFNFDVLLDVNLGIPITQGGLLFNIYPLSFIGLGAGGGWAVGVLVNEINDLLDSSSDFSDSPYVRGTLFLPARFMQVGVLFDYYFTGGNMQIGGYMSLLL